MLHTLGDSILLKILSYADPKPKLLLNLAATCRRFHTICTSDRVWARFNVHEVQDVYHHFLRQSTHFSAVEKKFNIKKSRNWYKLIWCQRAWFPDLDPYTQLMIILDKYMYGDFQQMVDNIKVLQLGIAMPGNAIFYASPDLQRDLQQKERDLLWQSMAVRQHQCLLEYPWMNDKELYVAFHLSYANLDSEFRPPFSASLAKIRRSSYLDRKWRVDALVNTQDLTDVEAWRVNLLLHPAMLAGNRPRFIRFNGQDLKLDETLQKRLETDEALQDAAIRSGVRAWDVPASNRSFRVKWFAEEGIEWHGPGECELSKEEQMRLNCYQFLNGSCYTAQKDNWTERIREPRYEMDLATALQVVDQDPRLYPVLCHKFQGKERKQLKRAKKRAKLHGKCKRPLGILSRQSEWYQLPPLHRPLVPCLRRSSLTAIYLWTRKDVYPRIAGLPQEYGEYMAF